MSTEINTYKKRTCIICEQTLFGRSDKVFCGITCKNKYHSEVRKSTKSVMAETNKIMNKNWLILSNLMTESTDRFVIKRLALERLGFNFQVISNVIDHNWRTVYGIYNFSYYVGNNNNIIVTQDKKQSLVSPYIFKRLLGQFPYRSKE